MLPSVVCVNRLPAVCVLVRVLVDQVTATGGFEVDGATVSIQSSDLGSGTTGTVSVATGTASSGASGPINIGSGSSVGSASGAVTLSVGTSNVNNADMTLTGGKTTGAANTAGAVVITGGAGTGAGSTGGDASVAGGDGTATGGDVVLQPGQGTGGGATDGTIKLNDAAGSTRLTVRVQSEYGVDVYGGVGRLGVGRRCDTDVCVMAGCCGRLAVGGLCWVGHFCFGVNAYVVVNKLFHRRVSKWRAVSDVDHLHCHSHR